MKTKLALFIMVSVGIIVLEACSGTGSSTPDSVISIAVWDLVDLSPAGHKRDEMGEMLAGQVMARFSEMNRFQVVERQNIIKAMEELHIGSSDLADGTTRLKLGRIIGAQQMVFGAFQVIGSQVRLDLRRVDVSSGKILKTSAATAASNNIGAWMDVAQQLAGELIDE